MINTPVTDYDITTMRDGRELILFNASEFTYKSALRRAKNIKNELGYGDDFIEPTDNHVEAIWVKNNPKFETNPADENAYLYSDPASPHAYLAIGVELIYTN